MSAPGSRDLIDTIDRTTGDSVGVISRGRALTEGADFRTVHVLVRDGHGRLLLQRLADERERHPGRWGSSVAAYPHAGESDDDAARRRLSEELGLETALAKLGQVVVRDVRSDKFVGVYMTESEGATIEEPAHIAELRWWTQQKLDQEIRVRHEVFTPTFIEVYKFSRRYLDRDRPE